MLKVAQIELIRRKVLVDGLNQRQTAKELGHSRRTVKEALERSSSREYRRTDNRLNAGNLPVICR